MELKKMVTAKDEEIEGLKLHINSLEQHNRAWSVRIMGLPLSPTEEKSSVLVRDKVYKSVILPILEGAAAEGDLQRLRLDRSTALYIYKAKNCKLLILFTQAQKTKFIFK
jgi:hypothetical protein